MVWIGFAAFFGVSLVVGVRLLALARRTGRAPELLIGLAVLGIGPIGFGLQSVANLPAIASYAEAFAATSAAAIAFGIWAKLTFNWLVYRSGSRVALAGVLVLALGVAAHLLAVPLRGSFLDATRDVPLAAARGSLQVLALGWGAAEAFAHWLKLRRRTRLGLADPVVTNRFLMWALSAGAASLGTLIGVIASLATGRGPTELPAVLASASAHGFVAAVGMWLAFAPPRAYLVRISGAPARV